MMDRGGNTHTHTHSVMISLYQCIRLHGYVSHLVVLKLHIWMTVVCSRLWHTFIKTLHKNFYLCVTISSFFFW